MKKRTFIPIIIVMLLLTQTIAVSAQNFKLIPTNNNIDPLTGLPTLQQETIFIDTSQTTKKHKDLIISSLQGLQLDGDITSYEELSSGIRVKVSDPNFTSFMTIDRTGISLNKEYTSYIIQFQNPPLVIKEKELDTQIPSFQIEADTAQAQTKEQALSQHESLLQNEHSNAINKIKSELGTSIRFSPPRNILERFLNFLSLSTTRITGFATANPSPPPEIINEYYTAFNGIAMDNLSPEDVRAIRSLPEVKQVYENLPVHSTLDVSLPLMQVPQVHNLNQDLQACSGPDCLTGKGVVIAIVDTGVDYTHPDLGGCSQVGSGCKVIGGHDFVNNDNDPMDDNGHGTHVASTAAGTGASGGLIGVAPDAEILAYKVLNNEGGGSLANVIAGINRAVQDGADIVSLSLGAGCGGFYWEGCGPDDPTSQTIDNAVSAGLVATISAGNSGPSSATIKSPATARKAITVAAGFKQTYTDPVWSKTGAPRLVECLDNEFPTENDVACFSSRGPIYSAFTNTIIVDKPDITAPGVEICAASTSSLDQIPPEAFVGRPDVHRCSQGDYVAISGTSMSAPHIAGLSALLIQRFPEFSPEEIKLIMKASAVDLGLDKEIQGAGRADALAAVQAQGTPYIASGDFNFGNLLSTQTSASSPLNLRNFDGISRTITLSATTPQNEAGQTIPGGITLSQTSVSLSGTQTDSINVNINFPSNLGGKFQGIITATDGTTEYQIPYEFERYSLIYIKVRNPTLSTVILAHRTDNFDQRNLLQSVTEDLDPQDGQQRFSIRVFPGEYRIYAFRNPVDYFEDPYLVYDTVTIGIDDVVTKTFNLDQERKFSIAFPPEYQGTSLSVIDNTYGIAIYEDEFDTCYPFSETSQIECESALSGNKCNWDPVTDYCYNKQSIGISATYLLFPEQQGDRRVSYITTSNKPSDTLHSDIFVKDVNILKGTLS
jgi:subtilisin family serine protease